MTADAVAAALGRLRELVRAGGGYGEVRAVLGELAAGPNGLADLARAGRLLARHAPSRTDPDAPEEIGIAVTGHGTLAALVPSLTAECARHGLWARVAVSDFDAYVRDLRDPSSAVYDAGHRLVLCVLDPYVVLDELPVVWRVDAVRAAADRALAGIGALAERYAAHGGGTLVLNTVPLPRSWSHQLVDLASRAELGVVWREFNAALLRLAARHSRVVVLDLDPLVAAGGPAEEPRLAVYAGAHLSEELLAWYAREVGHLARALSGRTKKVLVVDLDNTLWDGVLGDDGPDGIAAAGTLRGEAFGRFQRVVKQLGSQGVVLAVSSKNEAGAVAAVLRDHPDMVLREADFACVRADWEPKDGNLREIAARLNLGADSLVFADDSAFETGLVAGSLPEAAVVRLGGEPAVHGHLLLADGWFDTLELTEEDRVRGAHYRTEAARAELRADTGSYAEYLRRLDVRVGIRTATGGDLARVAQLTRRTNQFNLTTLRMGPAEVAAYAAAPGRAVLVVTAADRCGDAGVVGAVFARCADGVLELDNALLSCRVFGRGIAAAAVGRVLRQARECGLVAVRGRYRETAKNGRFREFYPSLGFGREGGDEAAPVFRHGLDPLPPMPGHLRVTAAFGTGPLSGRPG
ncbi:HAD-IIIC family phosphatase [Streptomyces sp. NPDC004296]|uniref:HAD-IIIC family phosphatase n=1 Tax=Streptomyces sp. NPDC004296 TaxID=3364697 RepID=UPI0036BE0FBC